MSNLSELLPAGGAAKEFEPVASGTLPNGQTVVLKSNGQVEAVGESSTSISESIPATTASFESTEVKGTSVAFDPNTSGKFVVVYRNAGNSNYGTSIVGQVSGTSISFGTEVIFNSGYTSEPAMAFDPNNANKFAVVYRNDSNADYGEIIVGTVSGTSISYGSVVVFNSASVNVPDISFDPNTSGKCVVVYKDNGSSGQGVSRIGTVSGTSISFGSEVIFESQGVEKTKVSFDSKTANKFVIISRESNFLKGKAVVGTVSGTSCSYGSSVMFNNAETNYPSIASDPNTAGKFIVSYRDDGNSDYGTAQVATVSGTSISFGTAVVFNSGFSTSWGSVAFDSNTVNKFVIAYSYYNGGGLGGVSVGTVSGTSISFGSGIVFNSAGTAFISTDFDPNNSGKFIISYQTGVAPEFGKVVLGQIATTITTTNLTSTNFVGITAEAITSGATGVVVPQGGVATNLSSLTIGSEYYVQANGTVSTVSTSPAVNIGKAISATSLILKG